MPVFKYSSIFLITVSVFVLSGCIKKSSEGMSTSVKKVVKEPVIVVNDEKINKIKDNQDTSVDSIKKDLDSLDQELNLDIEVDDLGE